MIFVFFVKFHQDQMVCGFDENYEIYNNYDFYENYVQKVLKKLTTIIS